MGEIVAFIFDLDGVITDTAEYHYLAWKQLAQEEKLPFTREDNDALRGVSRRQSLLLLLRGRPLPEATMQDWMARKNRYYLQYLAQVTPADLLPGVGAFLQEAKGRGLRLGLASASQNAGMVIERLGLLNTLQVIGDGNSVINPKPAPDLFLWVAGGLHARPDQTLVFEDAEAGIDAALAAGMYVVGLGPKERVGRAHIVLPSLDGVRVEQVLRALPTRQSV